jgi:hypothetical protein
MDGRGVRFHFLALLTYSLCGPALLYRLAFPTETDELPLAEGQL